MKQVISTQFYQYALVIFGILGAIPVSLGVALMLVGLDDRLGAVMPSALLLVGMGAIVMAIAARKRTSWYHNDGRVTVSWGTRLPFTYRHFRKGTWKAFEIKKELPSSVFLFPGGGMHVSSLPSRFTLDGLTTADRRVRIGRFQNEQQANEWQKRLT